MQNDEDLLPRVAAGDEEAFDVLYQRHCGTVGRHIQRLVVDPHVADDLSQEVFLRLWRRGGQWDGRGSVRAWLLRIATNLSLNHLRSRSRTRKRIVLQSSIEGDDEDLFARIADSMSPTPEGTLDRREELRMLRAGIDELPDEKRSVIELLLSEELSMQEISSRLDVPVGTVKSRIYYATRQLRECLEDRL